MFGNLVTGCSVLAPAGMLVELSSDLGVHGQQRGAADHFWRGHALRRLTTDSMADAVRIDRRRLLAVTLAVFALANAASALAPDYTTLLIIRLIMLAVGALYTPQAAGTAGLIVAPEKRGSTIAYVFLGWSLAAAVGLPLITFIASRYGWRAAYGSIGLIAALGLCLAGLAAADRFDRGSPVDLAYLG